MKQPNRILFITYDGLTDPLGQSQILPYYIGLSEMGYEICILSNEKAENFATNQKVVTKKLANAGIEWRHTHYQNTPPILGTLLNIARLKKAAKAWQAENPFDVFHCRSIIPAQIGSALAKENHAKLVFDIRGFWADERVDGGIWNPKNPIYAWMYRYFKKEEKRLFKEADHIITLTDNAKQYILKHFESKGKVQVIPCAANLEHFNHEALKAEKLKALRTNLNLQESDYVLTYIGSLGARYRLKEMLQFFECLLKQKPTAKFLFISKHDPDYIKQHWKEMALPQEALRITASEYEDIPHYIALANASIFFIVTSFSGKAVSPTKQAEVMGLGLPIVANPGLGDSDQILLDTHSGVVAPNYETETLNDAVQELLETTWKPQDIRAAAKENYALEKAVNNYAKVYQNL